MMNLEISQLCDQDFWEFRRSGDSPLQEAQAAQKGVRPQAFLINLFI